MKLLKIINNSIVLSLILFSSCVNSNKKRHQLNEISFEKDTIFFKRIKVGDSVTAYYKIKNISNHDIKIINVGVSCECTSSYFDTVPIKPGKTSIIKALYKNSKDTTGDINKVLVVETNSINDPFHPIYLISR